MQRSLEGTPPKQPPDTPCRRRYISLTDPALPTPPPPLPPSPPPPQGLDALEKYPGGGPAERVVNVLFGSVPPSAVGMARTVPLPSVPPRVMAAAAAATAGSLNDSQREAVAFALATDDVALIHGPPGRWVRFSERFLLLLVPPYHRVLTFIAVCMCIPLFFCSVVLVLLLFVLVLVVVGAAAAAAVAVVAFTPTAALCPPDSVGAVCIICGHENSKRANYGEFCGVLLEFSA